MKKKNVAVETNKEKINEEYVEYMNIEQEDNIYRKEENIKIICDQKRK